MYGTTPANNGLTNPNFRGNVEPMMGAAFPFSLPLVFRDHIIYSDRDYSRYQGKKLLLLGGGGSTLEYLKEVPAGYDYIWSLNNFFLNETIYSKIHVDLFTVGPEVDLQHPLLHSYLDNHGTIAAFEIHQKWGRDKQHWEEAHSFYTDEKKIGFQTKFYSQLGGGVRLLVFAGEVGFSSIDFVGFDGPKAIEDANHAFEKGKNKFSMFCAGMPSATRQSFFQQQYNTFWGYFRSLYPTLKIKSVYDNPLHKGLQ